MELEESGERVLRDVHDLVVAHVKHLDTLLVLHRNLSAEYLFKALFSNGVSLICAKTSFSLIYLTH